MIIDVMDLELKELDFNKSYDSSRGQRAKKIYRKQEVEIVSVDKTSEDEYTVTAQVDGSYFDFYKTILNIQKNIVKTYSCSCEDYKNGNICKHILATCMETIDPHNPSTNEGYNKMLEQRRKERELEIQLFNEKRKKEEKEREYQIKYSSALNAIKNSKKNDINLYHNITGSDDYNVKELYQEVVSNKYSPTNINNELATSIKLIPSIYIDSDSSLEVTFKIGQTMMYVLKDIEELYEYSLKNEPLRLGKKLIFIPNEENFEDKSKMMLKYILDYGRLLKYDSKINSESYYYYGSHISTKVMKIYEDKIDDFFETIKDMIIEISSNFMGKEKYIFSDEPLNIKLHMEKNDEEDYALQINLESYEYVESNSKIYVMYNEKIYVLDKNGALSELLYLFRSENEILIPKDKFDEFSTYVLYKFDNYLNNTNLPDNVAKEGLIVNKLACKIYLDLDNNGNITLLPKFCYLNYEFNILGKNYKNYVNENNIVRNLIEEKAVITRFFEDGFEPVNGKEYFVLKNIDAMYEFLSDKIDLYMNDFEVLVTDKFKTKNVKIARIPNISIKLDNGLLALDISKLDFDVNEIKNVLKNYNIKKKYYKLKNGDFLSLEQNEDIDFLNDMTNSFDINYDKINNNGIIKLPVNRSLYLEKLLEKNKSIVANKNDEFTKLVNNIENKNFSDDITIPEGFENTLRDYQKVGYKWLRVLSQYKFGGILADDMGLGKTLQVIALLSSDLESSKLPSIVVCPSSLVLNWKSEIEKWCNKINVLIIKGDAETRKELIDTYNDYNLIITSYDLLKRDVFEYEGKLFKYIIADEAQYIKNSATQNATALKSLNGEVKYALTGTPIENSISELWSIFDFIMPGYLYSYNKFKKKFEEPILKSEDTDAMNRLKALISPFVLRRIKKDVLTELPEKSITIMKNEMTKEQQKLYTAYLAQTKKEVVEELSQKGFEKSKFKILMLLTRLRQICCHPSLFIDNYNGGSGKLEQCMDIITDAIESGHKILLFSSYTSMFEIIEKELNKRDINYYKLTGNTPVDKRVEMVDQFNKNNNIKIFLISLKAGGTGLNLTGADVVIHYDPWWNVSSENQATDRAYRIGQKNSVQVYKLITTDSIEEKINKLQEKKAQISEQLLSTEETFINKLSKEEIMELFE